ncbi:sensor histidine kinase [Rhizobium paknamense]|uniref:histidine kinase n=1 Tax=Rhizobium paknamense TaxID=1206817 RepID=A0ABU0I9P6_9HYPH|nr:sensor histidine kinase [Rhizobium paknamense]MDQ0454417.1 two-component system sensor histidine kinase TctE [Rhizobium paknamense]
MRLSVLRFSAQSAAHALRQMRHSLRAQLLAWIMVTLMGVVGFNLYSGLLQARATASLVTDRILLGSARTIAEAVRVDASGTIEVDIPPAALEIFDTGYGDRVYYRVMTPWGNLVAGYGDLQEPDVEGRGQDIVFRNSNLRALMITHPLVGLPAEYRVSVTVAVTRFGHQAMRNDLWLSNFNDQVLLVIVAGGVTLVGLQWGLAPVLRLRDAVRRRRRDQLQAFDETLVHTELRPLVLALNDYMTRVQGQMAAQRRFVSNAAHQLRTPLTLLSTQAGFAMRETDPQRRGEALQALLRSTRQMTRLAEQLLTLTRAEPGSRAPRAERIDMAAVARQVLEAHAEIALSRGIDIGLEAEEEAVVIGDGTMLKEMLVNLVDNALRYTPAPGTVTVNVRRMQTAVLLTVEDSGPGIAEAERQQVFERFYRIIGTQAEGSGLGLAIVREVVEGAGGKVTLGTSAEGGLKVEVRLPGAV